MKFRCDMHVKERLLRNYLYTLKKQLEQTPSEEKGTIEFINVEISKVKDVLNLNETKSLNPLQVSFGEGRMKVSSFKETDDSGVGIILKDTNKVHPIGSFENEKERDQEYVHSPEKDEIYLKFSNPESVQVVIDTLVEAKKSFTKGE